METYFYRLFEIMHTFQYFFSANYFKKSSRYIVAYATAVGQNKMQNAGLFLYPPLN